MVKEFENNVILPKMIDLFNTRKIISPIEFDGDLPSFDEEWIINETSKMNIKDDKEELNLE